jgi:hypothetical protein
MVAEKAALKVATMVVVMVASKGVNWAADWAGLLEFVTAG